MFSSEAKLSSVVKAPVQLENVRRQLVRNDSCKSGCWLGTDLCRSMMIC